MRCFLKLFREFQSFLWTQWALRRILLKWVKYLWKKSHYSLFQLRFFWAVLSESLQFCSVCRLFECHVQISHFDIEYERLTIFILFHCSSEVSEFWHWEFLLLNLILKWQRIECLDSSNNWRKKSKHQKDLTFLWENKFNICMLHHLLWEESILFLRRKKSLHKIF